MEYSGRKMKKIGGPVHEVQCPNRTSRKTSEMDNRLRKLLLVVRAITRGPTETSGERMGVAKGSVSQRYVAYTDPASALVTLGTSGPDSHWKQNRHKVRGLPGLGEGSCPRELEERDVRWGCGWKCSQKPLDPAIVFGNGFWRLYQ